MHATTSRGDAEDLLKCLKKETPLLSLYLRSRSGIRSRALPGAQGHHRPCSCFVPKDLSQKTIQAHIHRRTEIQTAFLLHELHVLPISLYSPDDWQPPGYTPQRPEWTLLFPFHNKGPIIHFRSWTHCGHPYLCHLVIKATTTRSLWVSWKFQLEEKAAAYSLSGVSQGKLITAMLPNLCWLLISLLVELRFCFWPTKQWMLWALIT